MTADKLHLYKDQEDIKKLFFLYVTVLFIACNYLPTYGHIHTADKYSCGFSSDYLIPFCKHRVWLFKQ